MDNFPRTRSVLRWLIATAVMLAAAAGASFAIHRSGDDGERQQTHAQTSAQWPNVLTGGMVDHSVVKKLEDDAASNNPGLSVAAYDE